MKNLVAFVVGLSLLISNPAQGASVRSGVYRLSTAKVITIAGPIDEYMTSSVIIQMSTTANLPGPRLVLIRSPGGSTLEGAKIIAMLEKERSETHQRLVCAVIDAAHSMAFDILTHCDVRLATERATFVVHKVALGGDPGIRMTAKNLRLIAEEMEREDRKWDAINAKAMHLSKADYDRYADAERRWTAKELLEMHYLSAIVIVGP